MITNITTATNSFFTFTVPNMATSLTYRAVLKNLANPQPGIITSIATITVLVDSDNDGLPDAWESTYDFATNNVADAALDADGDAMANWQEYVAGTDPRDPTSYLRVEAMTAAGGASLTFGSVSNKTYTIQYRDALGAGPWAKLADVPARTANATETVLDANATSGRYYRLVTPRQP